MENPRILTYYGVTYDVTTIWGYYLFCCSVGYNLQLVIMLKQIGVTLYVRGT